MKYGEMVKKLDEALSFLDPLRQARDVAKLLASSDEEAIRQAETQMQRLRDLQQQIQALDVKYGERVREIDVATEKHKQEMAATLLMLQAQVDRAKSDLASEQARFTQRKASLQETITALTAQQHDLQAAVVNLERKKADLERAWESIRQKVGAA